jgi:hypothetical protein
LILARQLVDTNHNKFQRMGRGYLIVMFGAGLTDAYGALTAEPAR